MLARRQVGSCFGSCSRAGSPLDLSQIPALEEALKIERRGEISLDLQNGKKELSTDYSHVIHNYQFLLNCHFSLHFRLTPKLCGRVFSYGAECRNRMEVYRQDRQQGGKSSASLPIM